MTTPRFGRFVLRTTDVAAATAFYEKVLGGVGDGIAQLPEAAVARGAWPHWLGHVAMPDRDAVAATTERWLARGATRLGPPREDGVAILRDPGGASLALSVMNEPSRADVAWHQLNTADAPRAIASYSELFGWVKTERALQGTVQQLAFGEGEPNTIGIADIEGHPEIHPHWLFFFEVPDLDRAIAAAGTNGGIMISPTTSLDRVRVAVCEDAQRASFGLLARV